MLRVLLCDDAVAFGMLLERWMGGCDDLQVVGSTATPEDAERLAAERHPDVIVLDHMLGAARSDTVVPALRAAAPDASILLISGMPADLLERAAVSCGSDGCISKASRPAQVCDAVRALGPTGVL